MKSNINPVWKSPIKVILLSGFIGGLFIWCVMNLIVLPVVFPLRPHVNPVSFLTGAAILMIMIGLPVSLITHKYYSLKN